MHIQCKTLYYMYTLTHLSKFRVTNTHCFTLWVWDSSADWAIIVQYETGLCSDKIYAKININMHFLHHKCNFCYAKDHQLQDGLHWGTVPQTSCVCSTTIATYTWKVNVLLTDTSYTILNLNTFNDPNFNFQITFQQQNHFSENQNTSRGLKNEDNFWARHQNPVKNSLKG